MAGDARCFVDLLSWNLGSSMLFFCCIEAQAEVSEEEHYPWLKM